jgi:uncharacterized protein (TIGR03792 family)
VVIEWLQVRVPVADQARYIAADTAIWSAALARNAGYLGKEIWSPHDDPDTLNLVIRWASRAAWHAVPKSLLEQTDTAFRAAMGQDHPVLSCTDYDVKSSTQTTE